MWRVGGVRLSRWGFRHEFQQRSPPPRKEDLSDRFGPPRRGRGLTETCSTPRPPVSSGGPEKPDARVGPASDTLGLGRKCPRPGDPGQEPPHVVSALPWALARPGRPRATQGAAGGSTKDRAGDVPPALCPPASDVLGPLGALRAPARPHPALTLRGRGGLPRPLQREVGRPGPWRRRLGRRQVGGLPGAFCHVPAGAQLLNVAHGSWEPGSEIRDPFDTLG